MRRPDGVRAMACHRILAPDCLACGPVLPVNRWSGWPRPGGPPDVSASPYHPLLARHLLKLRLRHLFASTSSIWAPWPACSRLDALATCVYAISCLRLSTYSAGIASSAPVQKTRSRCCILQWLRRARFRDDGAHELGALVGLGVLVAEQVNRVEGADREGRQVHGSIGEPSASSGAGGKVPADDLVAAICSPFGHDTDIPADLACNARSFLASFRFLGISPDHLPWQSATLFRISSLA